MVKKSHQHQRTKKDNSGIVQFHDEFDRPVRGPIGLHRGKKSWWVRTVPFVMTFVIAALLAFGTWFWMSGRAAEFFNTRTQSSQLKTSEQTGTDNTNNLQQTTSNSQESNSQTSASTSTPAVTPTVDHSKSVIIYNGTGRSGFAGTKASTLTNSGYTSVSSGNLSSTRPSANTVWYKNDSDKVTAQDVATKLGISQVSQSSSITTDIAVAYISAQ